MRQVPIANNMIANKGCYSVAERFAYAKEIIEGLKRRSRTMTMVFGKENLPKDSNYIMYSNHQGKYDALGILYALDEPSSVLFGKVQAERLLSRQVCGLLDAVVIDRTDVKDVVRSMREITELVKNNRNILIFPEGGYTDNKNELQDFQTGCFACSIKSERPIVPVVLFDSWKSMNSNSFKRVVTQVHFLPPIPFEEFRDMKKREVAELVKNRIATKLEEIKAGDIGEDYELI